LPSSLKSNEQQLFTTYLSTHLKGTILAHGLNLTVKKEDDENTVETSIRKLLHIEENKEATLHYK